jgi:hypothetical protein
MFLMRSMREVQPGNVHAQTHQVAQAFFGVAGRTDGADDLGAARRAVPRNSRDNTIPRHAFLQVLSLAGILVSLIIVNAE